jgi:hypothetical protein
VNPVIRARVFNICLGKPELAEALYEAAVMELSDDSSHCYRSYQDIPIRASHFGYLLDV